MGWIADEAPGHEGYVVGFVQEPGRRPGDSVVWRELNYRQDDDRPETRLERFCVACECGWRSTPFRAPITAYWVPSVVELGNEDFEDACRELWAQHWQVPDALASRAVVQLPVQTTPIRRSGADAGDRLELANDAGGLRHFLRGQPVHAGTALELLMADGTWLPGRYEYKRIDDYLRPLFCVTLPCKTAAPDWAEGQPDSNAYPEGCFQLPQNARLRWPKR